MDKDKPLFELSHTRVEAQRARMEECIRLGICPFCWENLEKWHDAPVVIRGKFWVITANDHLYPGTKLHYLAIYRHHVSSISEIEPGGGDELFSMFSQFCVVAGVKGASIVMRFGDMTYNGATVFHLHAHLISGASRNERPDSDNVENWITAKVGYKVP